MAANLIVGMLCVHLLCFAVMFWLISTRLQGNKMGTDVFAVGHAMLGLAYVLQLQGGGPTWSAMNVFNHTLTFCVPMVYWAGGMRFFGRTAAVLKPLCALALGYTLVQLPVQWLMGTGARYAMLSLVLAGVFAAMAAVSARGMWSFAKDLRMEMALFALLIGGLAVMNAVKGVRVVLGGLPALDMHHPAQIAFYVYMSFLATVLAPAVVWMVLRRLTDALKAAAVSDPLTNLLNRRGLMAALAGHFAARAAGPARLLMLDIDHFKRVNDEHGHEAGDVVLCAVARELGRVLRRTDLASRLGGEEFAVICLEPDEASAQHLAERLRAAIEQQKVALPSAQGTVCCTVTIGVSRPFMGADGFNVAMREADAALYRGKEGGRNRIELAREGEGAPAVATDADMRAAPG